MNLRHVTLAAIALLCLAVPFETTAQTKEHQVASSQTKRTTHRRKHRAKKRRVKKHRARHKKLAAPAVPQAATTTPSGLTYVITQHGAGRQPLTGETVIVNYTGLLGNGAKFDSSLDHGRPFEFPLGAGRVIRGWDEGIAKLHVGDQATLIIPPELGYGAKGAGGVIPPNATLIFLVELVGIKEAAAPK